MRCLSETVFGIWNNYPFGLEQGTILSKRPPSSHRPMFCKMEMSFQNAQSTFAAAYFTYYDHQIC